MPGKHSGSELVPKHWRWALKLAAYILSLPFLVIWGITKAVRYLHLLQLAVTSSVDCSNCGNPVSLTGNWRCECGFTYSGHLMRPCPVCQRVPRIVRCYRCQATTLLH